MFRCEFVLKFMLSITFFTDYHLLTRLLYELSATDESKEKEKKDADDVSTTQSLELSHVVCADDQSTIADNVPGNLI